MENGRGGTGGVRVVACLLALAGLVVVCSGAGADEVSRLERQAEDREVEIRARTEDVRATGVALEEAQARLDGVRARAGRLDGQIAAMEADLERRQRAYALAQRDYEARAVAVYKGTGTGGLLLVLGTLLGTGEGIGTSAGAHAAELLIGGRADLSQYDDARADVRDAVRQLAEKRRQYGALRDEEEGRAAELAEKEAELRDSVDALKADQAQTEGRIRKIEELEAAEKARIQRQRAATRAAAAEADEEAMRQAQKEKEIARQGIVAEPVDLPVEAYMKLYKKAAADYGFASDWYVLAAVGQIESNHGENMGPSTAGAMGPMQFLPSTWQYAGVDGDGDGRANIMDPRDAIPAAAGYLRDGGAPEDWYAALYSYNHADWYVRQVLAVAEGYRQAEGDERTPPYV